MPSPDRSAWWSYTADGRYRLTADGSAGLAALGINQRAGTFVSNSRLVSIRDEWIKSQGLKLRNLAAQLKEEAIGIDDFVILAREQLKTIHGAQYVLGRGGIKNMAQSDWGRLGAALRQQYGFLNDFASQIIANPEWSAARIGARLQMYSEASGTSFEQGHAAGVGVPRLPAHPGDGQTVCLTNCKCYWRIVSREFSWDCYWTLSAAEHCPDCVENSGKWNPLTFPKTDIKQLQQRLNALSQRSAQINR